MNRSPLFTTVNVASAEALAGDLFRRSFNDPIPTQPEHFVLFGRDADGGLVTLAYAHFQRHGSVYLGGGMCVDTPACRRLPAGVKQALRDSGGVAYNLLSSAVAQLTDCDAVFGHVGHRLARRIDLSVGFQPTDDPHLIVYWKRPLSEAGRQRLVSEVSALGAF